MADNAFEFTHAVFHVVLFFAILGHLVVRRRTRNKPPDRTYRAALPAARACYQAGR